MKKTVILFSVLILSSALYSQSKLKYKDVYDIITEGEKEEAYAKLITYQKLDPEFANTYFQLGLISNYWARNYDPLIEYEYVKFFIYNTKLYYGLALLKLKNEKKKNRDLYMNASAKFKAEKPSLEDIKDYIEIQIKEIEFYENKINTIVGYFNQSSNNYNECLSIFKSINEDYSKIKNIWMSNDPKLTQRLSLLQSKFDTTITALDNYKKSIRDFPIKEYNQRYTLKNIYTYRLDGLTPTNFLNENIILWDFNSWTEQMTAIQTSSINILRKDIEAEQLHSSVQISTLKSEIYTEKQEKYKVDKTLYYRIEKFDYQSIIVSLFKYRESYINYMKKYREKINSPSGTSEYSYKQVSGFYYNLIKLNIQCSLRLKELETNINSKNVRKHSDFLLKYYKGISGLKKYAEQQKQEIKKYTDYSLIRYRKHTKNAVNKKFPKKLKYKNNNIYYPGKNYEIDKLSSNTYYVKDFQYSKNSDCYFTGFFLNREKKTTGFYAKTDSAGTVKYLTILENNEYNGYSGDYICSFETSNIILLQKDSADIHKHIIIKLNNRGIQLSKKTIKNTKEIVNFKFDEINNIAAFILKDENDYLFLKKYDLKEDKIIFTQQLGAKGKVFSLLKSEKNTLVFINYQEAYDLKNQKVSAEPIDHKNSTDILMISVDNIGNINTKEFYNSPNSTEGQMAIKLNSNTISISAVEKDNRNRELTGAGIYLLTDIKGKTIWINRHD